MRSIWRDFCKADLLPEVRAKSEEAEKVQSLVNTRTKLVRLENEFDQQDTRAVCFKWEKVAKSEFSVGKRHWTRVLQEDWSEDRAALNWK